MAHPAQPTCRKGFDLGSHLSCAAVGAPWGPTARLPAPSPGMSPDRLIPQLWGCECCAYATGWPLNSCQLQPALHTPQRSQIPPTQRQQAAIKCDYPTASSLHFPSKKATTAQNPLQNTPVSIQIENTGYLTQFSRNIPSGLGVITVFPYSLSSGVPAGMGAPACTAELGAALELPMGWGQ